MTDKTQYAENVDPVLDYAAEFVSYERDDRDTQILFLGIADQMGLDSDQLAKQFGFDPLPSFSPYHAMRRTCDASNPVPKGWAVYDSSVGPIRIRPKN